MAEIIAVFLAFASGVGGGLGLDIDVGVELSLCESELSQLLSLLLNTAAAACSHVGTYILAITRILWSATAGVFAVFSGKSESTLHLWLYHDL